MWPRLLPLLRCPLCRESLEGFTLENHASTNGVTSPEQMPSKDELIVRSSNAWVETGLLACRSCKTWFPVIRGVPVMLPYATPAHQTFGRKHVSRIRVVAPSCTLPRGQAATGEQLVMRSFSTEWLEYEFDGVIWEMDYTDHEQRFMTEMGDYAPSRDKPGTFLEIGCGLGITTAMAQKNFGCEAVGVDLSLAAWRATATNRDNPLLHFVQASVFALPFERETFDTIYTRGVLHHTFSTREAYRHVAPLCRPDGSLYVWVYGPKSINDNLFRRTVYAVELMMRFILNRCPPWLSKASLAPFALSYLVFNRLRRLRNPRIQPYNYTRALHAARDRFTPEFAHRHDSTEVCEWFREAGFVDIDVVDWRTMPSVDHDDYRRNTGVRARRRALAATVPSE